MKASELRIGNRLEYYIGTEGIEWQDTTIDAQDLLWLEDQEAHFNKCHRFIPLTEEWLLKFGFKSIGELHPTFRRKQYIIEDGIFREGRYSLRQIMNKEDSLCICNGRLQFVHQLQNLYFALTGEELTVKAIPPTVTE